MTPPPVEAAPPLADLAITPPTPAADDQAWLDRIDEVLGRTALASSSAQARSRVPAPASAAPRAEGALPLFTPPGDDDDGEPLIRMPAAPRPPLAVRKTPETPRLRAVPRASPRVEEPEFQFAQDAGPEVDAGRAIGPEAAVLPRPGRRGVAGGPRARLGAAALDYLILGAIDVAVVYFTLRMTTLPLDGWRLLPPIPLVLFLVLVKFAYFCAFTAVGGQTIGKMAVGLRVVTDDEAVVDGARAVRRTLLGAISAVTLGLGFLPALVRADRLALHDRLARTRVIAVRPV